MQDYTQNRHHFWKFQSSVEFLFTIRNQNHIIIAHMLFKFHFVISFCYEAQTVIKLSLFWWHHLKIFQYEF